jgi:D-alanyl-D-alanine dipeptidase
MKSTYSFLIFCCYAVFICTHLAAQTAITIPKKESGLVIISNTSAYNASLAGDSNKRMMALTKLIPGLVLDLRYNTSNNFMHRKMYDGVITETYMRLPAAKALALVQKELNAKNLGLKIFDAYRPYAVTQKFWELVHDERYVANPAKGSGHNRGIAVDLTIIDLATKQELNMGTGFDNFTDSAHHAFTSLSQDVLNNRKLLKETMEKYGFKLFDTEWWHYSWPNPEQYEVLDLSFDKLK